MPKKKSKSKTKEPLKLERVNERVKHNYTDDEMVSFAYLLGQKYRAIRAVQSEAKAVKKDYAARESSIESDIDELSERVNTRFEMRQKECLKFFDYKGGQVYWFLCDDLADVKMDLFDEADELLQYLIMDEAIDPVKQRGITQDERQQKLDEGVNEGEAGDEGETGDEAQKVETS